jgi:hypothetical protein
MGYGECEMNMIQGEERASIDMLSKQLQGGIYIPPSDRQKLLQKKELLERELAKVEAGIKMLDEHPDLEEFTKVLQTALS